ncbi:gastrula zinc finger protein XlCGF66.1-like [Pelodytes ibericus]
MDGMEMSQMILNLALEIVNLLTGENFLIVKNPSEPVPSNSSHCDSDGSSGTQISSTEPPPHSLITKKSNEQKIVELANQIVQLLTGEVRIRCEDVAVCFPMVEVQNLEGHKDLHKDVMVETQQTSSSQGKDIFTPT